ncbi:MAG: enoyl-CoA hydratase-related protein [Desulfobacterales bacterium]|nr:enoyl-CoA hydratase-related protein [Desulfobacterales bacterium]
MAYKHILMETQGGIATLTFNRPKALNALNSELLDEVCDALERVGEDEEIRVLILTGAGDKAFVAGADISELATFTPLQGKRFACRGHEVMNRLQALSIPVIAAVNGFALGGGSEMALACDFIYASEKAKFGLPEENLGLIPGFGGTQRLSRQVGKSMAKELIFTARMISAEEALNLGLVNRICRQDELMDEVRKVALSIADKGRVAIRAAKQVVNRGMDVDLATACQLEIDAFALCMASEDSREGTLAFMEKRKASFKGKLNG